MECLIFVLHIIIGLGDWIIVSSGDVALNFAEGVSL